MNILIYLWSKIQMDKILSPEGRCDQAQSTQLSGCVGYSLYLINQLALLKDFLICWFFFSLCFLHKASLKHLLLISKQFVNVFIGFLFLSQYILASSLCKHLIIAK